MITPSPSSTKQNVSWAHSPSPPTRHCTCIPPSWIFLIRAPGRRRPPQCPANPNYDTNSSRVSIQICSALDIIPRNTSTPLPTTGRNAHIVTNNRHPPPLGHNFIAFESTTPVPSLVASAHGVVVDLGPGAGTQLDRFDASRVEHIYGVEPNTAFAPAFADRLRETALGQDGKYTLVSCGVEDGEALARFGLVEGSVDCVVSMQVLVSLPLPPPSGPPPIVSSRERG